MELNGDLEELRDIFMGYLEETRFLLVDEEEDLDGGFRVLGVNENKRSIFSSVMMSLIGGFVPRNRVALELIAHKRDMGALAILRCAPYLDNADLETTPQSPQESKRCEELARALTSKILEKISGTLKI
ncbi:MAG: hypothetical protein NWE89_14215 [Candidatus Bathyarchaeota archaeon]|nr:hypothetical protein [Candidatus Bathyarchaeota archaeon]